MTILPLAQYLEGPFAKSSREARARQVGLPLWNETLPEGFDLWALTQGSTGNERGDSLVDGERAHRAGRKEFAPLRAHFCLKGRKPHELVLFGLARCPTLAPLETVFVNAVRFGVARSRHVAESNPFNPR
jgi:hypothetical protein